MPPCSLHAFSTPQKTLGSAPRPSKFSRPIRNALLALNYARPGWNVDIAINSHGDEWAAVLGEEGQLEAVLTVTAEHGSICVRDTRWNLLGAYTTPYELTASLKAFVDGCDRAVEAESQATTRKQLVPSTELAIGNSTPQRLT